MARAGITQQQVFEAAEALLQEGQGVTVSSVRERRDLEGEIARLEAQLDAGADEIKKTAQNTDGEK